MKQLTEASQSAKLIKKELKENFPDTKFSVKSKLYAGGDNITISWTDGPASEQVKKITNKYKKGDFNGIDDSYQRYRRPEGLPGTMFIFLENYKTLTV